MRLVSEWLNVYVKLTGYQVCSSALWPDVSLEFRFSFFVLRLSTLSVEENGHRHLNMGYGPDSPVLPRPFFVQEERSQVAMVRRPLLRSYERVTVCLS